MNKLSKKLKLATLALTPIVPLVTVISCMRTEKEKAQQKAERIEQYSFTAADHIIEKVSDRLTTIKIKITKPKAEVSPKDFALILEHKENQRKIKYIEGNYFEGDYVVFEIINVTRGQDLNIQDIAIVKWKDYSHELFIMHHVEKNINILLTSQELTNNGGLWYTRNAVWDW